MNKPLNIPFGLKPISEELLSTFQQLDNNQLQWLGGYCAGLAHANSSSSRTIPVKSAKSQLKTLVLYGSQTGNSESLAKILYAQLGDESLSPKIDSFDNIKVKEIAHYDIILLVVSTHGEGEPPDEAIEFYEQLTHKRAPKLKETQHAVLALGDSSYEYFCQTGKDFDARLIELGSKPILQRLDCDLDYEESSGLWIEELVKVIQERANKQLQPSANHPSRAGLILEETDPLNNAFSHSNPLTAKVINNQKVTGKGSSKTIHHLELSLENKTFGYLPGDGVAIWAKNEKKLVTEILLILDLSGEENIHFKSTEQSLKKTLSENLELTLLHKKTIKSLISLIEDNDTSASEFFKQQVNAPDFIKNNQFIDLLILANKSLTLSAQQLVDLLPSIKARVYSISSSLNANPDEVHITVALKLLKNDRGLRKGTASRFLIESLKENDEVLIYLEPNKRFRLPESDRPIIMIGPGTGVAPFRAFIQEREEINASGKNWLFFGNPHFNTDFLYQAEWQKALRNKVLYQLDVAFSRDQQNKIYVQDKLKANAQKIWQWIDQDSAHIYVCGDMTRMAKDVHQALLEIISQQGLKSGDEADAYLNQLRKDNRYQRDVY